MSTNAPSYLPLRGRIIANTAVIVLAILTLAPFLWFVVMSFKPSSEFFSGVQGLFFTPTLDNYRGIWEGRFSTLIWNSIVTSSVSTILAWEVRAVCKAPMPPRSSTSSDRAEQRCHNI